MTDTISAPAMPATAPDRAQLANELRALAGHRRLAGRAEQLNRLATDLEQDRDLERWAEVDLHAAFVRDDTVGPPSGRGGLATVLDELPGLLIFLPIVITWFGLFLATAAYRQSRGDPALAGRSFLEQWQTGFHGRLNDLFVFDRIALWTLLAVALLMSVSFWQAWRRRQEAAEGAELLRQLAKVLTDVDFELSTFRMNDASRLETGSEHLIEAARRMREVQRDTGRSLQQIRQALDRVEELTRTLAQGGESVRDGAAKVGEAATAISARIDDLSAAAVSIAEAAGELTRSAETGGDRLRQSLDGSARELRTVLGEGQQELRGALGDTGDGIKRALEDWRTEGAIYSHRHETTADHLALIVGSIEQLMERTHTALKALPDAVGHFEHSSLQASQRLQQAVTRTSQQIADDLARAADRIKDEIGGLLEALPDARARADQTARETAALRTSIDQLRVELAHGGRRRWRFW